MAKWLEKILNNIPNYESDVNVAGLTEQQKNALIAMAEGKNVFLTGGAGTGKSHVLKRFLELRDKGHFIVACAPTGIAALNLEWGVTVHKAFGVPVGEIADYRRITEAAFGPKSYVKRADTIIIDEISMCSIDVFDYAMAWLREIEEERGRDFQVIVCGDFFQLPPVMSDGKIELLRNIYDDIESGFCFESHYWPEMNFETHNLTEVIRQKDPELIEMLNRARIGDASCLDYFNQKVIDEFYEPGDDVVLSGRNSAVDRINNERLGLIDSDAKRYSMQIFGDVPLSRVNFVDELTLKVGARVMSLINDNTEHTFVNGSIGTVTSLHDDYVRVRWDNGEISDMYAEEIELKEPSYRDGEFLASVKGTFVQIPLKLCYAITIHKSQGQSIDRCVIFPNSFEKGQLYVAMSRCTNPEHLHFAAPIKESDLRVSQAVIDFYDSL